MIENIKIKLLKTKQKFILCGLVVFIILSLCGCAKVINTEEKTYTAIISGTNKNQSSSHSLYTGNYFVYIPSSTSYTTYFVINDIKYESTNRDIYNACKENVGNEATVLLTTSYYDNNTITSEVSGITIYDSEKNIVAKAGYSNKVKNDDTEYINENDDSATIYAKIFKRVQNKLPIIIIPILCVVIIFIITKKKIN